MSFSKQIGDRIRLPHLSAVTVDLLNCDRWIASSLLQKAIRRGEVEFAFRAACTLLKSDKSAIWRRLIVIAFEDVGAGDIDAVIETVFVASSSEWRQTCGELSALAFIVRRLAEATKDRSADYLACAAKDHSDFAEICDLCRRASLGQRLQFLADTSRPLAARAVAAWFSSGIDWRSDRQVEGGDLRALAAAYRELGGGEELVSSMLLAARRTREPIVILVPLIRLEVQRNSSTTVRNGPVPATKSVAGVQLYAFDKHTRIGKRAIARLVGENKPLRDCIIGFLAKGPPRKAAEIAAFYADAAPVARRLDWAQSDSLETLGIEADFIAAGLRVEGIGPVREAMSAALDQLNEIRAELWRAALGWGT